MTGTGKEWYYLIDVFIRKPGEHYTEYQVQGHAGYAEYGKDIVCASVSALTITLENSLVVLSDTLIDTKQYVNEETPRTYILAPSDKTDLLVGMYKIGIEGVQEAYPDHVKLHLET